MNIQGKITLKRGIIALTVLLFILIAPMINLSIFKSVFKNLFYVTFADYSYFNPSVFLSIGEAVAAIAIIFTVFQFKKDVWEIALEVRKNTKLVVLTLSILGLIFVIISSIVPLSFSKPHNILQVSLFWQLSGGILILLSPIFLFWRTQNKDLFNNRTKEKFGSALLRRVSSRSKKSMDLVADVLMYNLDKIFKLVSSSTLSQKSENFTEYAKSILIEVVSDPIFARHIVTSRADFFQFFLHKIKKFKCYKNHSVSLVFNSFIKASFENKDSYLYSELEYAGSGIYKPFLKDIFFDQNIFLNLRPFEQIVFPIGEKVDPANLNLFITALEMAVRDYWSNKHPSDFEYSHFDQAFEKIENAFSRIIDESRLNEPKDDWHVASKVHEITFFVVHQFVYDYKDAIKENKVSQQDLDVIVDRRSYGIYPKSLTAGYARLVFKLLCILDEYPNKEAIRHYAIFLADHILVFNEPEFSKIRELLLEYIWKQIKENVEKGRYPVILSTYLSLIGMWQDGISPQGKKEYNRIVKFLNKELKPKILRKAKMANDDLMEDRLLPPEVKFNKKRQIFEWQMHRGVQEMKERK